MHSHKLVDAPRMAAGIQWHDLFESMNNEINENIWTISLLKHAVASSGYEW